MLKKFHINREIIRIPIFVRHTIRIPMKYVNSGSRPLYGQNRIEFGKNQQVG